MGVKWRFTASVSVGLGLATGLMGRVMPALGYLGKL